MSSLATYLANKYLTASIAESPDSPRPKKRRKKDKSAVNNTTDGLVIADDDDDLALSGSRNRSANKYEDGENGPTVDTGARSAEFRHAKNNSWKPVPVVNAAAPPADVDQATADRILAQAAEDKESRMRQVEGEDGPTIADEIEDEGNVMAKKPSKAGGLQTAQDSMRLEAAAAVRRVADSKSSSASSKKARKAAEAEETVYRDATGRRIDISMRRAEVREAEEEKRRQERRDQEAAMGEVQRKERQEKRQAVEEAKFLGVARYADDESMNEEMKGVGRWGDPMLAYVREQEKGGQVDEQSATAGPGVGNAAARSARKEYHGAAAPNRYGIRPGWRWDGVDRGNGFEKDWFQARGRKSRNENLEYQWQMDE